MGNLIVNVPVIINGRGVEMYIVSNPKNKRFINM